MKLPLNIGVSVDTFRTDLKFNILPGDSVKVKTNFIILNRHMLSTLSFPTGCDRYYQNKSDHLAPEIMNKASIFVLEIVL